MEYNPQQLKTMGVNPADLDGMRVEAIAIAQGLRAQYQRRRNNTVIIYTLHSSHAGNLVNGVYMDHIGEYLDEHGIPPVSVDASVERLNSPDGLWFRHVGRVEYSFQR